MEEHKLVGVTVEKLREIFRQPDTEPMVGSFRVSEAEARALEPYLSKPLQLLSGRSYLRFWTSAHGWAPSEAAELLSRSRLDRQVSLSHTLKMWLQPPSPADHDGR